MSALPVVGEVIAGKYRIEGSLGEGGMAHIFAAHHELLDKPIAVKILSPLAPQAASFGTFVERFLTEARAAAKVDNPHVARVMDVGTLDNGLPFMVMERLDGCDLEELLRLEHNLPVPDAVDYMLQALHGLAHAHALGIVHRDLKPANLFLAHQPDGTAVIKIVDFGIAKMIDLGGTTAGRVTGDGSTVGSPMYMSPEQVRNAKAVDHRADIWAMGVVLYELLVGKPPFGDDEQGVGEIFAAVLEKDVPPLRKRRVDVPSGLESAVMKCLERDVDKRFADVSQLASEIAPFGSGKWTHLVDGIEQAFRRRLTRMSGAATPGLEFTPVSRRGVKTETSATLDDLRPPPPSRRSRWAWIGAATLLLGAGIGLATHEHALDGVLSRAKARFQTPVPAAPPPVVPNPTVPATTAPPILSAAPTPAPIELDLPAAATSASVQGKKPVRGGTKTAKTEPPVVTAPVSTPTSSIRKRPSVLDSAE